MHRYFILVCLSLQTPVWGQATASAPHVSVHPGFEVQLIRSAQPDEDSWVSMTFDDQGRLLLGLDRAGIGRLSFSLSEGTSQFEKINETFLHCRGILYWQESLYVSATNSNGFYRLRDTNGDGNFDQESLLFEMDYRSRYGHGANQIVPGPDGMLYLVVGNDVSFPESSLENSPYRDPRNDKLLINEFDTGQDDRVGYILRIDADGGHREILAGGFRNQFDMAFNADGEMFTYDADMEWDIGLPWYRPTRLNHIISGGEYGWRWGTMKWPTYYQDSLPTTLDTGLGSPTGMIFGYESQFPARYRDALYLADWQNGRIYLVDLIPDGATYRAEYETFLQGGPLNVCDMTFGPDGALYFITGGRGSQSGLYRVTWTGQHPEPELPQEVQITSAQASTATAMRALRHQLEHFHTQQAEESIDLIWHAIASEDRWMRHSARVALENQPVALWRERALDEATPWGSLMALMALVRVGETADQPDILAALQRQTLDVPETDLLLGMLRLYALTFIRQGTPDEDSQSAIRQRLEALYPHADARVNQELSELLVWLQSPHVLEKTLTLLAAATTQEEQIHYAKTLTHLKSGWTIQQRRQMLDWLQQARRFPGGRLVNQTIQNLILEYRSSLDAEHQQQLAAELAGLEQPLEELAEVPLLPVVQRWTMADLLDDLSSITAPPADATRGELALAKANCLKCHRVADKGGQIGPDLTQVGARFDVRAILESILEPSKVIDEKYRQTTYVLTNGKLVTGRPVGVSAKQLVIETDPLTAASLTITREEIEASKLSTDSPMPAGLVDVLTREEILDLIAYLKYRSAVYAAR